MLDRELSRGERLVGFLEAHVSEATMTSLVEAESSEVSPSALLV